MLINELLIEIPTGLIKGLPDVLRRNQHREKTAKDTLGMAASTECMVSIFGNGATVRCHRSNKRVACMRTTVNRAFWPTQKLQLPLTGTATGGAGSGDDEADCDQRGCVDSDIGGNVGGGGGAGLIGVCVLGKADGAAGTASKMGGRADRCLERVGGGGGGAGGVDVAGGGVAGGGVAGAGTDRGGLTVFVEADDAAGAAYRLFNLERFDGPPAEVAVEGRLGRCEEGGRGMVDCGTVECDAGWRRGGVVGGH
jgi:hypothetical protein